MKKRRIGLALGSGSARGWSHIGVIRQLVASGIYPDVVCGASIGAIVGVAYAGGKLNELEDWVISLNKKDVMGFFDLSFDGGLIKGKKLFEFFHHHFAYQNIEELPLAFGAVATDLNDGIEVWLRDGDIGTAVRASISLPGIFTPVFRDDRWLVDGGLTNPVPVSLCRAMGADFIIAVDLNQDLLARHKFVKKGTSGKKKKESGSNTSFWTKAKSALRDSFAYSLSKRMGIELDAFEKILADDDKASEEERREDTPGIIDVMGKSINIMQTRISRSRMAGDPPDVLITPRLPFIGLLEFHRAHEAIAEGERVTAGMDFSVLKTFTPDESI